MLPKRLHNLWVVLPASYQFPTAIILLGGGLLVCFLGYRLLRVVLGVYGFVFGAVLANSFLGDSDPWQSMLGLAGGGLVGTLAWLAAYFVGVALVGAALGALIISLVSSQMGNEPHWVFVIIVAIAGAFVALALRRYVIIVGTSFGGAWTTLVGGLALTGNSIALAAVSGDVWVVYPLTPTGQQGFAIAWFGLALLAVVVQLGITGKPRKRRG